MKKIILGCAAVLLSLGLLAGCNNKEVEEEPPIEEAVVITVDSSASVVVGESLALTYTVSPAKAEVVAASDNEDVVTAVAQSGTLYLEGVAEGSAIVTLVGTYEGYASANKNINVSVITKEEEDTEPGVPETGGEGEEPETTAVTLTLTTSTLSLTLPEQGGTAEAVKFDAYTVTPEGADVLGDTTDTSIISVSNLEDGCYITPLAEGEATVTLTAEYTSDEGVEYTPDSAELKVIVSEYTAPEPEPVFESYTITVNLQTSEGEAFPDPETDYSVWIQSSYDGTDSDHWGDANEMTYVGSGVYEYVYTSVPGWTSGDAGYDTNIIAGHDGEPKWENFNTAAITLKDTTSLTGEIADEFTIQSAIGDTWEEIFPPESEDETTFYLVLVDASKGGETADVSAELDVWFHTSESTLCWDGTYYCQGTQTVDSTNVRAWYSQLGTTNVNHNDWFNASYNNAGINFGGNLTIPSNAEGIPVFVVGGWCNDAWANGSEYWNPVGTPVWETLSVSQTIQEFITATDLNSVIGNSGN